MLESSIENLSFKLFYNNLLGLKSSIISIFSFS
ncbi:hypothetical protein Alsa3_CDS0070 [Staphylococcus phage Alsa_3]|nr:hypothetical protein Alsa2_CDS0206 [Staphylococcus phage Alsa_2]WNM50939.1 hypothetical protein Alsa3_CDS0070 [Staphylococcus phage Alsa_3]WNM51192.1 hypothetical protein Alsa4_CDS0062 [Staphylococcus phage Alsa_4]WNM56094.1 hypothetical protein CoNPh38_CDS0218 [Staphylococcus phage S-CoN_Ph38]